MSLVFQCMMVSGAVFIASAIALAVLPQYVKSDDLQVLLRKTAVLSGGIGLFSLGCGAMGYTFPIPHAGLPFVLGMVGAVVGIRFVYLIVDIERVHFNEHQRLLTDMYEREESGRQQSN